MAEKVIDLPLTIENVAQVKEELGELNFKKIVFTTDQVDLAGWQLLKCLQLNYPDITIEIAKSPEIWEEFLELN